MNDPLLRAMLRETLGAAALVVALLFALVLSGCTLSRSDCTSWSDGTQRCDVLGLSIVQYPPDAKNVQATDAAAFYITTPIGLTLGVGGVSNLTAPVDADLTIRGGVNYEGGEAISAKREIAAGQLTDDPVKPGLFGRLFGK